MKNGKHKLGWSRWIAFGGSDPRDIAPSEYDGPVQVQLRSGSITHLGNLRGGQFLIGDVVRDDVVRWKPAPVEAGGSMR